MSRVMNQNNYARLKRAVDNYDILDAKTVKVLLNDFGFSEQTFRRIKRSRNFADYQVICLIDSGKQPKMARGGYIKPSLEEENERLRKECDKYKGFIKAEAHNTDIWNNFIRALALDNASQEMCRMRRTYSRRSFLWFLLGLLVGTVIVAFIGVLT